MLRGVRRRPVEAGSSRRRRGPRRTAQFSVLEQNSRRQRVQALINSTRARAGDRLRPDPRAVYRERVRVRLTDLTLSCERLHARSGRAARQLPPRRRFSERRTATDVTPQWNGSAEAARPPGRHQAACQLQCVVGWRFVRLSFRRTMHKHLLLSPRLVAGYTLLSTARCSAIDQTRSGSPCVRRSRDRSKSPRRRRIAPRSLQVASRCALRTRCANAEKRTTRARRACLQRAEANKCEAHSLAEAFVPTSSKTSNSPALNAATDSVPKPVKRQHGPLHVIGGHAFAPARLFRDSRSALRAEGMHGKCEAVHGCNMRSVPQEQ